MKKKVILFGAGSYGKRAYEIYHKCFDILCFVDNNKELVGGSLFGKEIISKDSLTDYLRDDVDVWICAEAYLPMCEELELMSVNKYHIFRDDDLFAREKNIKRCSRCVMDNVSDQYIVFNKKGECNYCSRALKSKSIIYLPNKEGKRKLESYLREIKKNGKDKPYDCIMGISGGLDSSYLLYLGYKWGLRVLAIHIDDGYDTDISKANIEKLVEKTGFDYEVICPDEEQYNDLILSYMKAGVPNLAAPQDNILLAFLYKKMKEYGIKYFLSGGNFALEGILQRGNTHDNLDVINIKDIHNRFGRKEIDDLEFISRKEIEMNKEKYGIESLRPLNYIDYNRDRAFKELFEFCYYEYYGRKHLENIFTAFLQLYWLPKKFGVDKRTSHLSSMIISEQMTRSEAVNELQESLYDCNQMNEYIEIIRKKTGVTMEEFEQIMRKPGKSHTDYKTEENSK